MRDKILERFLQYVQIDTQSDASSKTTPSTKKQLDLAKVLVKELKAIGLQEVEMDKNGYIMATLPSNIAIDVPTIGFVSHYDTSPDFSGTNVKPKVVKNYQGQDIVLNKRKGIVLSPDYFPELKNYIGQTLITTDGNTLLGADDKAGITEIICAMDYLVQHPEIPHGKIRVGFTPDEEIGRGAHLFDVEKFGADWAYTMDGSEIGELEYENFNAAGATLVFHGKSVHPGYAKGKMVNSLLLAQKFMKALPKNEVPEKTSGYEGFFHVAHVEGTIEQTKLSMIIRDHNAKKFAKRKKMVEKIVAKINHKYQKKFGAPIVECEINDQYYNMREKVEPVFHIVKLAEKAMKALDIKPIIKPIRGGTDGSQLSYKGLPCPNIFAGGHNFHGKYEYVPLESMEKAMEVIVKIAELHAKKHLQ
ncbi:MAG: peptidase T [Flavobacteriales bacterium]|nr:peptidase T [Flavobacteriales bacterium]